MLKNAKEISPCVLVIDDAIKNCQEIIDKATSNNDSHSISDAKIFGDGERLNISKSVRDTKIIDISPTYHNDSFWWLLSQKLWQYGNEYGKLYDIGFSNMEFPQLLWYKKNEGFYNPHIDSVDVSRPRKFSLVLYLNNVEEGGETHFDRLNISVKPKEGRLCLFPANFVYLHGAKTPKSEDKYAIVTWFNP